MKGSELRVKRVSAGISGANRIGLGCEISQAYCDVALRRLANLTGEDPVLAETGQTMAEVSNRVVFPWTKP